MQLAQTIITITVLFTISHASVAQDVELGVVGGVTRSGLRDGISALVPTGGAGLSGRLPDADFGDGNRTTVTAGVFATVRLLDWFSVRGEARWIARGGSHTREMVGVGAFRTRFEELRANYVAFPVLARLSVPTPMMRPFITFGPVLRGLLGCSWERRLRDAGQAPAVERAECHRPPSFTVELAGGGGVQVLLGAGRLSAEARFAVGPTPAPGVPIGRRMDRDDRAVSILVGYAVPIG